MLQTNTHHLLYTFPLFSLYVASWGCLETRVHEPTVPPELSLTWRGVARWGVPGAAPFTPTPDLVSDGRHLFLTVHRGIQFCLELIASLTVHDVLPQTLALGMGFTYCSVLSKHLCKHPPPIFDDPMGSRVTYIHKCYFHVSARPCFWPRNSKHPWALTQDTMILPERWEDANWITHTTHNIPAVTQCEYLPPLCTHHTYVDSPVPPCPKYTDCIVHAGSYVCILLDYNSPWQRLPWRGRQRRTASCSVCRRWWPWACCRLRSGTAAATQGRSCRHGDSQTWLHGPP